MVRRLASLFFACFLLAVGGCRNTAVRESVFGSSGKTVIRISTWGGAGDDGEYDRLVQQLYERYERENPGVDIQVEGIPGEYVHKMLLNFVAGTQPDVMVLDASSAAVFVDNGLLQDLSPLIAQDSEFRLDDYFSNVVDIARRGDRIHAIPGDFTPMVLYYNKDLFDRAGVPYPKAGWTFADFLDVAKRLTVPGKHHGFAFANWMPGWVMWLWNNGGDVLSPDGTRASGYLDSPQNVETIEFLRDLIKKHQVSPSLSEIAAMGVDPFANGEAAMTVSGHWSLTGYKNAPKGPDGHPKIDWKRLGVVELPHNTPQARTVMYEAGYAIPKDVRHPELAWKLVKMLASYRHQSAYNRSGIAVCARKDVSAERARAESIEREFLAIVPQARPPWGAKVEGYEAVERIGKSMMDSVLNTDAPVLDLLRKAAERIDREFAKR